MSMSKEDGWKDFFCHWGKLAGHYYVGYPANLSYWQRWRSRRLGVYALSTGRRTMRGWASSLAHAFLEWAK